LPGVNGINLFTVVIYKSFCIIKLFILGNYHAMAVNNNGIKFLYNIRQKSVLSVLNLKYHGIVL